MGAAITIVYRGAPAGRPNSTWPTVDWLLLVVVMVAWASASIVAIGILLAAICLQTRQESWSLSRRPSPGRCSSSAGPSSRSRCCRRRSRRSVCCTPLSWWIEGVRLAVFPAGLSGIGGPGSLWTGVTGTPLPDGATIVLALLVTGGLVTLAATGIFRASERRAKDRGLLDRTTGS